MQVCVAANIPIINKLCDSPNLYKSINMSCQLLYSIGEVLPIANEGLLAVQTLVCRQGASQPKVFRLLQKALIARSGKTIVQNVMVPDLVGGIDAKPTNRVAKKVSFSTHIKSLT